MRDGTDVKVRVLRPGDSAALEKFVDGLSEDSIYYRFLTAGVSKETLVSELSPRPACLSLVAIVGERIVGLASYCRSSPEMAEVGLLIADDFQGKGRHFRLVPGTGVHIPVNAPHWVKNDANISVSVSMNFEWRDEKLYNVYRANHFLRRLGIQPCPPGVSTFADTIKHKTIQSTYLPLRHTLKSARGFYRRLAHS